MKSCEHFSLNCKQRDEISHISLILKSHTPEVEQNDLGHIPINSTEDPSTFLKKDEFLGVIGGGHREELKLVIPDNQHLFLRVIPQGPTQEIGSSQRVLDLLNKGKISPMIEVGAFDSGRNQHGAFAVAHENENILALTQVFRNRELWGIDTSSLDKNTQMVRSNVKFGYFPCILLENLFIQTLSNYLPFCRNILELPLPLKFIVGATRVEGYKMAAPSGMHVNGFESFGGRVVEDHIVYEGTITDFASDPKVLLRPFFEKIWEECGLKRPDRQKL